MPGTSSVTRSQSQGVTQSGTGLFSVNGGRPQDNNFTLDGVDSNMQMMNSPESRRQWMIQEFKVATNTGSEFGRSMGANISMVMKSGTRDPHGTLYEYLRNDKFDANEFFANRSNLGRTPFRLNQYGVTLGGPVMLPKVNLRDKMFWFFSWEGFRPSPWNDPPDERSDRCLQAWRLLGTAHPGDTGLHQGSTQDRSLQCDRQDGLFRWQHHSDGADQSGSSESARSGCADAEPTGHDPEPGQ
jgi:hypothetical protein